MSETISSGGWQATLVQAGTLPMEGTDLAPAGQLPKTLDVPSNVLVLRGHGRTILVDTAAGGRAGEWEGAVEDLDGALSAAGVDSSQIDTLVLTHLDFDHCGGVQRDGRPAFPQARVVVSPEAAGWAAGADDLAAAAIRTVRAEGLLDVPGYGEEVAPDVWLAAAPGHRVGHSILRAGEATYLADLIHHPAHVANLTWDREFDSDPELALATRRRILGEMTGPVACSHIAGWGRIERLPDSLAWEPL
jgi:glyoxylase-like metal-dependent hydrolase (beta-lactamase superfamily II)